MKVILLKDVPKLGRRYEVKEVAPGFARAVLFVRGQAAEATPAVLKQVESRRQAEQTTRAVEHELMERAVKELDGTTIALKARAGNEGQLFAALHAEDVSVAIKREKGLSVDPAAIILKKPLKHLGFHQAKTRLLGREVAFTILIEKN